MATIKNTIAKAEKLSGQKVNRNSNNGFSVGYKGYSISFQCNGRFSMDAEAICFYVTKHERSCDDYNSDYWPGTFYENLTKCFKSIDRKL